MPVGTFNLYTSFKNKLGDGTYDLDTNTFKVMLVTSAYTPSLAHTTKANITNELATANGYTAGGATLANVQYTGGAWDANNVVWTASGGSLTARYFVVYQSGTFNTVTDALVGYGLLDNTPADVTVTDTNTLTLTISNFFTTA